MSKASRGAKARRDLRELTRYIAIDTQSVEIAVRVVDRIDQRIQLCLRHPDMGALCPQLGPDIRRTVVDSYSILYRKTGHGIQVVRIIHASRDLLRAWNE